MGAANYDATFLTDALTMFSLTVSIRLALDEISTDKAKALQRVGNLVAISIVVCYVSASIIGFYERDVK